MNKNILDGEVQEYIKNNWNEDVHKIAMSKSPFEGIGPAELANQIAARNKSSRKLPSWHQRDFIYYPSLLSIEQCSSEVTAAYKAQLAIENNLIDLTGGFGVDSYYFAKRVPSVTHCEINNELSEIAAYNAAVLQQKNIHFLSHDGIAYLKSTTHLFDNIYIDPARRNAAGKVFMLKDCTPNVVEHLDLLFSRSKRIIIKTAPLLDITAGLKELKGVIEIHIVSIKNECKELLWVIDSAYNAQKLKITAVTLNELEKKFTFYKDEEETGSEILEISPTGYLYEPDAALLKTGAFNLIGSRYSLKKLDIQTQLYVNNGIDPSFPGRIFKIINIISSGELKKRKNLEGNVIVRNYRDKAENLVKKYKIKPDDKKFLIFTQSKNDGYLIIEAIIEQHY